MERKKFEKLVEEGFELLPERIREKIKNVAVLIEDDISEEVRRENELGPDDTLLGLYHGIPLTERGSEYGVGHTMPDTITIYQRPIEKLCGDDPEKIRKEVCDTVWHEVAHHFGMDEHEVRHREAKRQVLE